MVKLLGAVDEGACRSCAHDMHSVGFVQAQRGVDRPVLAGPRRRNKGKIQGALEVS
jgi:hypothetical protein